MIILIVFAEIKIIKKADSYNKGQPNFYFTKKLYWTLIIFNSFCFRLIFLKIEKISGYLIYVYYT